MSLSLVDMVYSSSGYERADTTSEYFVPTSSITGTYVPQGEQILEGLASISIDIIWTGTEGSTSGNLLDDRIIAEFACYVADNDFQNIHVNPETGEPENRHWATAMQLAKAKYGILVGGEIMLPGQVGDEKSMAYVFKVDNTQGSYDST